MTFAAQLAGRNVGSNASPNQYYFKCVIVPLHVYDLTSVSGGGGDGAGGGGVATKQGGSQAYSDSSRQRFNLFKCEAIGSFQKTLPFQM